MLGVMTCVWLLPLHQFKSWTVKGKYPYPREPGMKMTMIHPQTESLTKGWLYITCSTFLSLSL